MTALFVALDDKWIQMLAVLPENGMGYQKVDVLLRDGHRVAGLFVYNAEQLEWPGDSPAIQSADIAEIALAEER